VISPHYSGDLVGLIVQSFAAGIVWEVANLFLYPLAPNGVIRCGPFVTLANMMGSLNQLN
jgi:hypothetical protein